MRGIVRTSSPFALHHSVGQTKASKREARRGLSGLNEREKESERKNEREKVRLWYLRRRRGSWRCARRWSAAAAAAASCPRRAAVTTIRKSRETLREMMDHGEGMSGPLIGYLALLVPAHHLHFLAAGPVGGVHGVVTLFTPAPSPTRHTRTRAHGDDTTHTRHTTYRGVSVVRLERGSSEHR
jgi:hypothetical protein